MRKGEKNGGRGEREGIFSCVCVKRSLLWEIGLLGGRHRLGKRGGRWLCAMRCTLTKKGPRGRGEVKDAGGMSVSLGCKGQCVIV
jgi:hypothetical protein